MARQCCCELHGGSSRGRVNKSTQSVSLSAPLLHYVIFYSIFPTIVDRKRIFALRAAADRLSLTRVDARMCIIRRASKHPDRLIMSIDAGESNQNY